MNDLRFRIILKIISLHCKVFRCVMVLKFQQIHISTYSIYSNFITFYILIHTLLKAHTLICCVDWATAHLTAINPSGSCICNKSLFKDLWLSMVMLCIHRCSNAFFTSSKPLQQFSQYSDLGHSVKRRMMAHLLHKIIITNQYFLLIFFDDLAKMISPCKSLASPNFIVVRHFLNCIISMRENVNCFHWTCQYPFRELSKFGNLYFWAYFSNLRIKFCLLYTVSIQTAERILQYINQS